METQIYPSSSSIGPNPPAGPRSPPRTSAPTDSSRNRASDISPTKPAQALLAMANAQAPPMLAPLTPSHSAFGPPLPTVEPPSSASRQAHLPAPLPPPPLPPPKLNDSARRREVAPVLPPPPLPRPPPASMSKSAPTTGKERLVRKKQKRYRANAEQLERLVALFDTNMSPSGQELIALSRDINMPHQSVVLWFKNRRARAPAKKAAAAAAAAAQAKTRSPKPVMAPRKKPKRPAPSTAPSIAPRVPDMSLDIPPIERAPTPPPRSSPRLRAKATATMTTDRPAPLLMLLTAAGTLETGRPRTPTAGLQVAQRRPRPPQTPRIMSQRNYQPGDRIEVLETGKGYVRSWYSAKVLERKQAPTPTPLSLGVSAAADGVNSTSPTSPSPRRISSPMSSPTPPAAKARYKVQYEHIVTDLESMTPLVEVITASRLRPEPPVRRNWKPEIGHAVEALSNEAAWFTGVVRSYAVRKGFLVSFEGGQKQWYRRYQLRPYQIWRGGDDWIVKTKAPAAVARTSANMSVTHPQQGTKRAREELTEKSLSASRRRRTAHYESEAGPEGLPSGWKVMEVTRGTAGILGGRRDKFYTAPDGRRLRSLKEARKYVRLLATRER